MIDAGGGEDIVLLLCDVALNVEDELLRLSRSGTRRCSCSMASSLGSLTWPLLRGWSGTYMAYSTLSGSQAMLIGSQGHTLILAGKRRRDIRAILLGFQLRLNANVFEILLHELHGIDEVAAIPASKFSWVFNPLA